MARTERKRSRGRTLPLHPVTFVVCALLVVCVVAYFAWDDVTWRKEDALHTDQVYSARIESLLTSLFHKTDVLEAMTIAEGGAMSEETFSSLARSLSEGTGIRAIQYLPDGVVTYIYPMEGNEATLNTSVFDNPERREDALLAVETGQITLSGPYELLQGGLGLIGRNPVFFGEGDDEAFWGFVVIVLDLPQALDPIKLSDLEDAGYDYELLVASDAGERLTIASSQTPPGDDAIEYGVSVPNHDWALRLVPKNGWLDWGMVLVTGLPGLAISLLLAIVVRQMQTKRRDLHALATSDELTGLRNRRWLSEQLERWCTGDGSFAVCYLDLNGFKTVNDTLGHRQGDLLLVCMADRLRAAFDETDAIVRMGGDEFVVVRRDVGPGDVDALVAAIRAAVGKPVTLDGTVLSLTAGIGVARYPDDGADFDALLHCADKNMYRDKREEKAAAAQA